MDEYKDIYPKDIEAFNKLMEQKQEDYSKKIGKNLRDQLQRLGKSSDFGKLKVFSEELIYLNYKYQKRIQAIKSKIINSRIDFCKDRDYSSMMTSSGPSWCIDYCDELLKWVEENMENV